MGFVAAIVVSLVLAVVGELLRPKVKPQNAKASGLDDFDIPTAQEGRSIPVIAGKVKIDGPNVIWYGDLSVVPIKKKVKTGWFSSATQILGHKYYLGLDMAVAHGRPDFTIHEIRFGDKVPINGRAEEAAGTVSRFEFLDENFYGGKEKEGGVVGRVRFYRGVDGQPASAYMTGQLGKPYPAYEGLAHAVFEKVYLGTSTYLKPISFVVSSYPNQLGVPDGKHKIGDDCNPICFIYELMTERVWGATIDAVDVDQAAFVATALKLHEEGLGMSLIYNQGASARESIADILRHIDGVIFSDPSTGLITIRLARADYEVEDLPVYGPNDFVDGITFSRPSWSETKNTIKVTYTDREANYTPASFSMQDLANITQRGGEIEAEELDFSGFMSYAPAARAGARASKTMGYPLAKVSGSLTRRAWNTRPGDVFVLQWPDLNIASLVMRVIRVEYDNLSSNRVQIEAVEDVFSVTRIAYVEPPPSGWVDPVQPPTPLPVQRVLEAPLYGAPSTARFAMTLASTAASNYVGYDIAVSKSGGPYEVTNSADFAFTPSGVLTAAYSRTGAALDEAGFTVSNVYHQDYIEPGTAGSQLNGANLALIGDEWISWRDFTDNGNGTLTFHGVIRGVLDTVPQAHVAGDRVWFMSEGSAVTNEQGYDSNVSLNVKLLTRSVSQTLDIAAATPLPLVLDSRALRPLPPGKVRINNTRMHLLGTVAGTFTLSWARRSALDPIIRTQDEAGVSAPATTRYNVRYYDNATNSLIASGLAMDAESANVALAFSGTVRQELEAVDGLASWTKHVDTFVYDGTGVSTSVVTPNTVSYVLDGGGA